jgi:hypothetical protein
LAAAKKVKETMVVLEKLASIKKKYVKKNWCPSPKKCRKKIDSCKRKKWEAAIKKWWPQKNDSYMNYKSNLKLMANRMSEWNI